MNRTLLYAVLVTAMACTFSMQADAQTPEPPVPADTGAPVTHAPPPQPQALDVQMPVPADPHLARALDYVTVSGIKKLALARARFALLPVTQQARRTSKETDPAFWSDFQNEAWNQLQPKLPDMILGVAKIYAGMFSDSDLDAMIAFERSPAGEKLQTMRPQIARAELKFTRAWADAVGPEIAKHVLENLQSRHKPNQKL